MRELYATGGAIARVRAWRENLRRRPPLRSWTEGLAVGVLIFLAAATVGDIDPTAFNNYSWLGNALIHGQVTADDAPPILSLVPFNGHKYIVEPPWPGVLMMPLCLFAGTDANQTLLSAILLAVGTAACWLIVRRLGLTLGLCTLLTLIFLFATPYFYGGYRGDVWQIAEVSADTFLLLAILEASSKNRPAVVATLAFAAAMSRFPLLAITVAFMFVAWFSFGRSYAVRYAAVVAAGILAYAAYNVARWQTPFDQGYKLYETAVTHKSVAMFGFVNLQNNVEFFVTRPPIRVPSFPWVIPDPHGTGILFTSLVFTTALFAPLSRTTLLLWAATLLSIAPSLLYYDAGDAQYYNRHFLDCAPFVLLLLARAVQTRFAPLVIGLGILNVATGIVWALAFPRF